MTDKTEDHDTPRGILGLNDAGTGSRGEVPGQPSYTYVHAGVTPPVASSSAGSPVLIILIVALLIVSGVNLYLALSTRMEFKETVGKHTDQLNLLTRRLDSSDERYARLSATFQVTTKRLGLTQQELSSARSLASEIQKQQQAAVQQLNEAISQKASTEEVNKLQNDTNNKVGAISGDLAGTKKDLEATKEALMGAKSELGGSIARTHDELVALAHKTDRDYFEFNLTKRGSRQKLGAVLIELARTNPKKNQFTVNLYYDDKRTERKDKAVNEPVYFYVRGATSALELVVNKMARDSVSGYISAPKGFLSDVPNVLAARPGA